MMKILSVFGTRPEAVKMAPVVHELLRHSHKIISKVCVTGQHREMLDQVLSFFHIQADYDLNLMQKQQNLNSLSSLALINLQKILEDFKPDWVLVQGDTTTAFISALAAFYQQIKIAHVEAGLRTYNLSSPWPEEANRNLISVLSQVHYAPTQEAANNLLSEKIAPSTILNTGNTVVDALIWVVKRMEQDPRLQQELAQRFGFLNPEKRLILVTGHRRENWEKGLSCVFQALRDMALRDDVEIIYPVHLNPVVLKQAKTILQDQSNIFLVEPADYLSFVYLMQRCYLIVTDSGGVQEEAPSLGKPVLVTRDTTERPEAIQNGTAKLVGTEPDVIKAEITRLLEDPSVYQKMSSKYNLFGDGLASQRIVADLLARSSSHIDYALSARVVS